jgi:hypothetical protein
MHIGKIIFDVLKYASTRKLISGYIGLKLTSVVISARYFKMRSGALLSKDAHIENVLGGSII